MTVQCGNRTCVLQWNRTKSKLVSYQRQQENLKLKIGTISKLVSYERQQENLKLKIGRISWIGILFNCKHYTSKCYKLITFSLLTMCLPLVAYLVHSLIVIL